MNIIDFLLLGLVLFSVYIGYLKGFIIGMSDLFLLMFALMFAFFAYQPVAGFVGQYITSLGAWTLPVSFLFAYIVARLVLGAVFARLLGSIDRDTHESGANKIFGIFPGAINGLIYAAIASALVLGVPISDGLSSKARESRIAASLSPHVEWAEEKFAPVFDKAVNESMNKLTIAPGSEAHVELGFTYGDPRIREDLEAEMLVLINEERAKAGLRPLKADAEMREVARAHSVDMFAKGYFSHVNKEGESPFDRIREARVKYITAGENLALAQTLRIAHRGLMNSPGHRANILRSSFGRVGIGILEGGRHGLMITQNFRN